MDNQGFDGHRLQEMTDYDPCSLIPSSPCTERPANSLMMTQYMNYNCPNLNKDWLDANAKEDGGNTAGKYDGYH